MKNDYRRVRYLLNNALKLLDLIYYSDEKEILSKIYLFEDGEEEDGLDLMVQIKKHFETFPDTNWNKSI